MNFNYLFFPTLLLGFLLFRVSVLLCKQKMPSSLSRMLLAFELLAAIPAVLYVLFYLHFFDGALWFYKMRTYPGSELAAAGAGLLTGRIHRQFAGSDWVGKISIPVIFIVLLLIPYIKPLIAPLDYSRLQDHWIDGVCMQSAPSTCGPSSAATLLKQYSYPASESELARECFTYQGGTEIWFLARALIHRGFSINYQITAAGSPSALPCPAIAGVALKGGAGHFIAVVSETSTNFILADPLIGKRTIPKNRLGDYYRFTGFFLHIKPETHQ
jgi:hypothetical protein